MLPPLPPTVLLLLLLPPPPLLPRLEAADEEEEATAAEAACVEDVVAQSSEDFSAMIKSKQSDTLIATQHKFAHSARHASPFATAEPQCSNTLATTTTTRTKNEATHKSRHR